MKGISFIEIILAVGLWSLLALGGITAGVGSMRLGVSATMVEKASELAVEGAEAAKAIRSQGWTTPFLATDCSSGCGIGSSSGSWNYVGTSNTVNNFQRQVIVEPAYRDVSGNLATSGTIDSDVYKVTSRVSWNPRPLQTSVVNLVTYLTNYTKAILTTLTGGIMLYSNGTTTPQTRSYNPATNVFSAATTTVIGNIAATWRMDTSPNKTEAVAGYVNSAGVLQVMCFNGTTWTNEWSASVGGTGTDRRFDVAYETTSGDVIVLYGTNVASTNELAYRTKLGSTGCGTGNWSVVNNFDPLRTSGTAQWVKMAPDRRSGQNNVAAIWADGNSDLSGAVWSGSAWVNEPTTALETALEVVAASQDVEDFDLEYETLSGDLMVVWANSVGGNGTNGVRYRVCTGGVATCTWGAVTTPPTFADDATHLDLAASPTTDAMVFASVGNGGNDLQIGYWSGTAWTNTANADTSCNGPAARGKTVSAGWLVSGVTLRSVVRYADQGSSGVDWYVGNGGVFTKQTDFAQSPAPATIVYSTMVTDPINRDQLMSVVSDGANDLFAKRLIMTVVPVLTWTNSDGVALSTTLPQSTNSPFVFNYWKQ